MANELTSTDTVFDFQLDEFYLDLQEDGRNISILSSEEIAQRPFPGLRPFKTSEFQLFRGRGGQAEELIKRLKRNRFLAVIGSSGTGKSSLVRAGLIPELFGGSLREAGSKWNIAVCRPGKNPIANLAVALSSVKGESKNKDLLHENFESIEPLLSSSIYGLLEANETLNESKEKSDQTNLLIIVDQFEEIFRYDRKDLGRENIENHFVDLLLKAASNAASPVYVIITMRSEFLGDCVKYRGLPEAINEGQYLVPGLNRTQLKDVIEGPIKAAGRTINPGLVELLINELDEAKSKENLDQLPILQHALMRTYQEATRQGSTEITYEHYERIGGMEKALANHAREKFVELGDGNESDNRLTKKQQIAKVIFQALTDASTDLKGGRRPTELKNIYAIAMAIGATKNEVDEVIDKFRDNETSFIMPPINTELHDDLIMDISHESLMRNWDLLRNWIDEEVRYGKLYQRLNDRREEDGQFIQGALLTELVNWRENYPHNAAWAARYQNLPKGQNNAAAHEDLYNKNLLFLKRSEEAALSAREAEKLRFAEEAKLQREEDLRRQKEKSRRRMMWLLTTALVVALSLTVWAFSESSNAKKESRRARDNYEKAEGLNSALRMQTDAAEAAKDSAKKDRDYALSLYGKLNEQKSILEQTNKALAAQTAEAERQRKIAEKASSELAMKSQELERHLAEGQLHNENFFTSKSTSAKEKEEIISYLFNKPLNEVKIDAGKYMHTALLPEINTAVKARDTLLENPVAGLRLAEAVWARNKTQPVMDVILPEIFKRNVFHDARIDVGDLYSFTPRPHVYTTSPDGARFGLANTNKIAIGGFKGTMPQADTFMDVREAVANYANKKTQTQGDDTYLNTVSFSNDTTVTALVNDGLLVQWKGKTKPVVTPLPGSKGLSLAEFSPDASYLVTAGEDNLLKIWPIKSPLRNPSPDTIKRLSDYKPRKVIFSPGSQRMLVLFDELYALYDMKTKSFRSQFESYRYSATSHFTNDNNFYLMASSGPSNVVWFLDTLGRRRAAVRLFSSTNDENFSTASINEVSLSPDWKTLLVNQGGTLLIYQKSNADSIFSRSVNTNTNRSSIFYDTSFLSSRKLFSFGEEVAKTRFLDANTVIALTAQGKAYVWRIRPYISLQTSFDEVRRITDSTNAEKLQSGTLSLAQITGSKDKTLLRNALDFYLNEAVNEYNDEKFKEPATAATQIYTRLSVVDSSLLRPEVYSKFVALNDRLYSIEAGRNKPDTLKLIETLTQMTRAREKLLLLQPESADARNQLSLNYWNLSWLLVLKKHADAAISCAKRSVALSAANNGAYTNLALAYLIKGDYPAAEKIYLQYKDSLYADGTRTVFKTSFLTDLEEMEKDGIITRENAPLYKEMLRIRNEILDTKQVYPKMKK